MFRAALLFFLAQALYALVIFLAAIAKIVEFGWYGYVMHFTNWSWTLQILFYGLTLPFIAYVDWAAAIVSVAFLPLVTVVFSVWLGSSLLLVHDGNFIEGILEDFPAGIVIVGNDIFHVLPVISILTFSWLLGPLVFYSLRKCLAGVLHGRDGAFTSARPMYLLLACVWQVWGGALAVVGLYRIFFDPNTVYETDLSEASALGLVLLVGFFVAGGALCVMTLFYGLLEPFPRGSRTAWAVRERKGLLLTKFERTAHETGRERLLQVN